MQQCCLPAGEQLSDAFLRPPCLLRGTASVGNSIATLCCDAGCDCSTFRAEPLAHTICEPHHPLRVSARGTKSTATILDALRPKSQENNGRTLFCILYQSKIIVSVISTFILAIPSAIILPYQCPKSALQLTQSFHNLIERRCIGIDKANLHLLIVITQNIFDAFRRHE